MKRTRSAVGECALTVIDTIRKVDSLFGLGESIDHTAVHNMVTDLGYAIGYWRDIEECTNLDELQTVRRIAEDQSLVPVFGFADDSAKIEDEICSERVSDEVRTYIHDVRSRVLWVAAKLSWCVAYATKDLRRVDMSSDDDENYVDGDLPANFRSNNLERSGFFSAIAAMEDLRKELSEYLDEHLN